MPFCPKCGAESMNNAEYCSKCGEKINPSGDVKIIKMKCRDCGGELEINSDTSVILCPYCGSKSLVLDSEKVRIERMRINAVRDIELENIRSQYSLNSKQYDLELLKNEQNKRNEGIEAARSFRKSIFSKILLVLSVLILMLAIGAHENSKYSHYHENISFFHVGSIQSVLFFASWMIGSWCTEKRIRFIFILLMLAGFALVPLASTYVP
jgi:DNA-directed RNA polymerase subunit RPC12/RpoP